MNDAAIRVLYLNHVAALGGAERGLLGLVAHLDKTQYQPVVGIPADGALGADLERLNVRWLPVAMGRHKKTLNPWRLVRSFIDTRPVVRSIAELVRDEEIDIVHANSTTAQIYAGTAAKLSGRPCIWHCRDLVNLGVLGRWLEQRSTRIIAVSSVVARCLEEQLSPGGAEVPMAGRAGSKVVVIHNGTDLAQFKPRGHRDSVRREFGIAADAFVVAMVAHMAAWKKHDEFLRIASLLAPELPNARFLLIGGDLFGDQEAYLKKLKGLCSPLGLTGRVIFAGARSDMPAMLESIDVLVQPATREPFGRAIIEAMAMAKPVVASGVGGPAEIIQHGSNGILARPGDTGGMAKAITRLARDMDYTLRLSAAGRMRAESAFSVGRHVRLVERVYDEVLERRRL